jgi:hypothetical protein
LETATALIFKVSTPTGARDVAEVRYDCACGCHPNARYQHGAADPAHEHCCCGIVHFAGPGAASSLRAYLDERRKRGDDSDVGPYAIQETTVPAPWGGAVPVAYAIPARLRAH